MGFHVSAPHAVSPLSAYGVRNVATERGLDRYLPLCLPKGADMVVDNSEVGRLYLTLRLRRYNFTLVPVQNDKVCLKVLQTIQPDFILMDFLIPELDGWDTLTIRSSWSALPLPSFAVTANDPFGMPERLLRHRCTPNLPKP